MRVVAFIVFFSIGAAVLSATVLCDDTIEYFHNKALLKQADVNLKKLETLDSDYDTILKQLEGDPCQLARLAPATLGIEPNEPNTAYPRATADKLAAAKRALIEEPDEQTNEESIPPWLGPCCRWPRRHILFFSGAALVLISFIFFGPTRRPARSMTVTTKTESAGARDTTQKKSEPHQPPENK
jgi:ABC-type Fe3+-siderophore transport system permease subunit